MTAIYTEDSAEATLEVKDLVDLLALFLSQNLNAMPRKDAAGRSAVNVETGTVAISSGTITTVSTVSNVVATHGVAANSAPYVQTMAPHIYNNIVVS